MEFGNFYNIKTEQVGGWTPPPGPLVPDRQKVNPFMQWAAVASISGMVASTTPAANSESSKEDSNRSATITASTALQTGRQVVTSVQGLQGYNHVHQQQSIIPIEAHPQQQHDAQPAGHDQQQQANAHNPSEMIENSTHVTPVPSPHQGHAQPANDTAFPGGQLRHNYSIHQQPQPQQQQQHHQSHLLSALSHQGAKPAKPVQKNAQGYLPNGEVERNSRGEKVERVYDCPDCDKSFTREEHLKRHARIHTDDPVHRCEVIGCTKAYTRKERLTRHYKVAHLGQPPERPFWCSECGKDFQRKEHLQRHQRNIHGPNGPHPAGTNPPVVHHNPTHRAPASAAHHVQQQPQQQQQQQPQQQQNNMNQANGTDSNGQPLLHCTYEGCPKTYSRREHLNRHIKLHMGIEPDRPYYCMDCGKTFTRKEHLLRHKRAHTGETPYPCPVAECPKQFARKEHLKRHVRVHTGEHPYPCSESFGRRERLVKHLKSHGINNAPPIHKMELKKEPENDMQMGSHGVFGDQTTELLNMIAKKGPLSPEQLGMCPPPQQPSTSTPNNILTNPDVAKALANPEIVRAFQNPNVVKAFALTSPPKRTPTSTVAATVTAMNTVVHTTQAVSTPRVDITCTPAVPPELTKLPPGFSIFPVVPTSAQEKTPQMAVEQPQVVATVPSGYYQTNQAHPSHIKPGELTTIPMSWTSWPMQGVNIRSPAKLEPTDGKHWEPTTAAYFRSPFS